MGFQVLGLGETDFALGLDFLLKLKAKAQFSFLSSNIVDSKTEKPIFEPYVVREVRGIKIGIFSVIDSSFVLPEGIKVLDSVATSQKMVQELSSKVDVIIALTHQGLAKDVELTQKVSGIDIMIGGHDKQHLDQPTQIKSTLILESGDQGKYVGVLNIFWKKGSHFNSEMETVVLDQAKLAQIDEKLSQLRAMTKDDLVARQEQELLRQKWDLEQKLELMKAKGNSYQHELVALDLEAFGDGDKRVFKAVQAFKKSLASIQKKGVAGPSLEPRVTQQGNRVEVATYKKCSVCHKEQYDVWKESKHASAVVPLYIRNQHLNPECIVCHSVGFHEPGGFKDLGYLESFLDKTLGKKHKGSMVELRDHPELDQKLRRQYVEAIEKAPFKKDFIGVQCENCHSPRGVKDALGQELPHQVETELPKKVVAQSCLKCHTPSQSPAFNFEKDLRILGQRPLGEKDAKAPFHCKVKVAP
ncbi:MAG: hypothetical protein HYW85_01920 [Deltaproteobacteria bacterium]|nr:hypothetical protein [Deltaproteobacteria bacterium]MBI3018244.1 hypothetical protein [Deltaproteobacteria bacterium]